MPKEATRCTAQEKRSNLDVLARLLTRLGRRQIRLRRQTRNDTACMHTPRNQMSCYSQGIPTDESERTRRGLREHVVARVDATRGGRLVLHINGRYNTEALQTRGTKSGPKQQY